MKNLDGAESLQAFVIVGWFGAGPVCNCHGEQVKHLIEDVLLAFVGNSYHIAAQQPGMADGVFACAFVVTGAVPIETRIAVPYQQGTMDTGTV